MDLERIRSALAQRQVGPADGRKPCAVLVPLVRHRDEDCLLFEVRAAGLRWQPGDLCFPGGHMEPGEEPLACALRETQEELGIVPEKIDILGPLDYVIHRAGFPVFPFLARFDDDWATACAINPDEVDELVPIPLSYLRYNPPQKARVERVYHAMDTLPEEDRALLEARPGPEPMPILFWPYEGKLLWGMTARVTAWLLDWLAQQT
jgi:8-oxo-dGTP pyrophosphatase MutT (NUDIX family)